MESGAVRGMLAELDFRRLLRTRLVGQCGDGLLSGALFGAAFFNPEKATTAPQAAAAFATLLLPYSLVGPFAGVLLDRWSRQRVLVLANLTRAVLLTLLAGSLTQTGATSPSTIGLALVVISLNRFVLSGLSAALPHVVLDRVLVTANAFTTTLGSGAAAVGGVTSLGLRDLFGRDNSGAAAIAVCAAAVYLVTGLLATRMERSLLGPHVLPREPVATALKAVASGFVEGARHLRRHPAAAYGLAAMTAHRFFYGLTFLGALLLYTEHGALHRGLAGLGQVVTASIAGGLVAALVTPRVTRRIGMQRWIVVALAFAAVVEVAAAGYTHPTFLLAALGLGFSAQAAKICVDTLVQEAVDDDFRGRVFALYDTLFNVSFVSAAAVAAVILPDNGKSYAVLAIICAGYALTALVYAWTSSGTAPRPRSGVRT
ncbi:MAG: Major Facilitator Superfamily protein [Frankiales bacterium]|nr:Major Facilitator Superfamily protein [Frankiales bacterium]